MRDDLNAALAEIEQLAKDYADADAIDELEEALIADIAELEESFTAAKTAIEAEEDARKQADADLQAQLDAALKRIEELEANKASKWLGIIALLVGIFGTVGAVWFIIDKFAGKKN